MHLDPWVVHTYSWYLGVLVNVLSPYTHLESLFPSRYGALKDQEGATQRSDAWGHPLWSIVIAYTTRLLLLGYRSQGPVSLDMAYVKIASRASAHKVLLYYSSLRSSDTLAYTILRYYRTLRGKAMRDPPKGKDILTRSQRYQRAHHTVGT